MRFTRNTTAPLGAKTVTTHEGGTAYKLTPEQELVKMALTSFVDKTFYEDTKKVFERITSYTANVDPDFLLKLAIRGRKDGLRTINQILTVEGLKSTYFPEALQMFAERPDDLIEIVGYYAIKNNQAFGQLKLANKLKKGIATAIQKFDLYRLCKYKNKGDGVNLYDLINLTHPKVKEGSDIDKFIRGDISEDQKEKNVTREKAVSKEGNKEEVRDKLIEADKGNKMKKLDALATIRNLANMKRAGVSTNKIIEHLKSVSWKKIFPYQAIQAIDVMVSEGLVKDSSKLVTEIIDKLRESFSYIADLFPGRLAIGIDCSGSMDSGINGMSSLRREELARYYGLLIQEAHPNADIYPRANQCKGPCIKNTVSIHDGIWKSVGGGTEINTFFNEIKGKGYDYAIVITDEQTNDYNIPVAKSVVGKSIMIWNIADYENTIFPSYDKNYTYFCGFNDKMFRLSKDLLNLQGVVEEIKKIDLFSATKEGR